MARVKREQLNMRLQKSDEQNLQELQTSTGKNRTEAVRFALDFANHFDKNELSSIVESNQNLIRDWQILDELLAKNLRELVRQGSNLNQLTKANNTKASSKYGMDLHDLMDDYNSNSKKSKTVQVDNENLQKLLEANRQQRELLIEIRNIVSEKTRKDIGKNK